ncbi:MAG TPA: PfkB family carbohydrate kinase [Candidatus Paceibacterota bacterium]
MEKERFIVVSNFAKDIITYAQSKQTRTFKGGPAFWIIETLKNLKVKYQIIVPHKQAIVRITVQKNKETGKVVYCEKIKLSRQVTGSIFLISTILNEFSLSNLKRLKGFIAMDIQGYARAAGNSKISFPKGTAEKIDLIKATSSELKKLPSAIVRKQKNKILIVTRGVRGFQIFAQGEKYEYHTKRTKSLDTIGAGDTLLTAFVVEWLKTRDVSKASGKAQSIVGSFLDRKKKAPLR